MTCLAYHNKGTGEGVAGERWRRIFLDPAQAESAREAQTEERFFPLRAARGLTSSEHFARYLFAAGFCAGKRVLDVACGVGYGSYLLSLLGAREVVGLDRDQAAIELAGRAYAGPGIEFRRGEAEALGLDGPPFDVVVSFETIDHVERPEELLAAIRRRLAPDGLFIVSCPHDARSPWVSPFHLRHYTYREFRDLVARCFPDPVPVSQIHAVASLVLPMDAAAAGADDLSRQQIETYLDLARPVEDSDVFLLLCGRVPEAAVPTAVITRNLSDWLREIYSGVQYIRERVPHLESALGDAESRIERQRREILARDRGLEDMRAYALDLERQLEEMRYSRTWQLMLACRAALSSPARLLGLPLRLLRILANPPAPPAAAAAPRGILPQYLPHRLSAIVDWPGDRPLLTVGIPCYNYGRFLPEAIQSVLGSTFQDLEILVINDGSTDPETLGVLDNLRQAPPAGARLRVLDQPNQGLAAARNKGAALARGKYVLSLDADDHIAATYLEKAVWTLERQPQCAFCYPLVRMFGAEESIWKTEPFSLEKALRYNHVPTGAVFRREAWVEVGGFREHLHGQDDWNFWITVGAEGWEGCLIEEPLFHYRQHQTSMWSQIEMQARQETARKIQGLHAYLTGEGDPSAAAEFGRPQDPEVRAALDWPEPPPPQAGTPIERRRHLRFDQDRPAVLFALPWMAIGGAEQVVLQVMRGLAGRFSLAAATTLAVRHDWHDEFERISPWIYHLARLPLEDPARYLCDLIAAHGINGVVISGSALAYQALPMLKQMEGLWTADIIHNTVPEGYLETSIRSDRYLNCHFAVGGPQRDALIQRGGVAPEKIRLAPASADAQGSFNPASYADRLPEIRGRLGLKGGEVVLCYVGRLAVEKDVPLFVRVVGELVRRHPAIPFHAFIVGDGPERARVEHQIRTEGLPGVVEVLGFSDQVGEVLAASRFSVLPSRFEGSSITLIEAMSMGQVVASTDTGSVREVIEDGMNGFIVSSREPADFAARLGPAVMDSARAAAMGERARRTVVERYDLTAMVEVYAQVLDRALARRASA